MPSTDTRPRAAIYVPHGAVPDQRGFAPAIVAWQFARRLRQIAPCLISAREHYRADFEYIDGIPVHRIQESRLYRRLFRKATRLDPWPLHRRAARLLERERWDLLHAHQLEFPVADFQRHVRAPRPILLHAHVTTNRFDAARGVAARYIAASGYVRERLIEAQGYPSERVVVVQNGVDTELFAPAEAAERSRLRARWGLPPEAAVLAFVGRKQEVKGFHVFLRTLAALLPRHAELYAIAAGPELDEARRESSYDEREALRATLHASGRLIELPAMPQTALADVLRAADLALLPSQAEPQGLAMIEAMASGCVTISSNVGGIRESIRHGDTGYLLQRADDVDEAIALCEQVLQTSSQWPALRARARADIAARFAWEVVSAKLEALYFEVLRSA
jgi:glycosyltransferase involved in cell wall biosynthesis